jgi:hypothetical protein
MTPGILLTQCNLTAPANGFDSTWHVSVLMM